MAIIKAVSSRASIGKAIKYITKDEKTEEKLVSGIECSPGTAIDEMKATKEMWNKEGGREYKHFIHSFPPKEKITPSKAHELAKQLCEKKFKGHEVLIATHKDKEHIHSHIIVNSVNYENGYKLRWSKKDLEQMKERCNELSQKNGLSVPTKSENITSFNQKKYKALEKGFAGKEPSEIINLGWVYKKVLNVSKSKDEFIKNMNKQGYEVNWKDTSKNITFTTPGQKRKIRLTNLEKTLKQELFTKGALICELQRNKDRRTIGSEEQNVDRGRIKCTEKNDGNRLVAQPSDGIVGEIQSKIQGIKDRTSRATETDEERKSRIAKDVERKNKEFRAKQSDSNQISKSINNKPKPKPKQRNWDWEQ